MFFNTWFPNSFISATIYKYLQFNQNSEIQLPGTYLIYLYKWTNIRNVFTEVLLIAKKREVSIKSVKSPVKWIKVHSYNAVLAERNEVCADRETSPGT